MIVLREKNGSVHFSIYKLKNNGTYSASLPNVWKSAFIKVEDSLAQVYIENIFGRTNFSTTGFLSIHGVRNRNCVDRTTKLRPTEGLVMVYRSGADTVVLGKREINAPYFEHTIDAEGQILAVTTGDVTMDSGLNDELILEIKDGSSTALRFAEFDEDGVRLMDEQIDLGGYSSSKLFFFRKSWYQFS